MPSNFSGKASPHARKPCSKTSVSLVPRKAKPIATNSSRSRRKLKISPLKATTSRPRSSAMGCDPVGERSMMLNR